MEKEKEKEWIAFSQINGVNWIWATFTVQRIYQRNVLYEKVVSSFQQNEAKHLNTIEKWVNVFSVLTA